MLLYSSGSDCPLNYLLQREGTIIMNLRSFSRMRVILFLAMILMLVFGAAAGEEYDSNTMRLLRHEGTVEILNPEGEPRFVLENVRFESGETLQTGEDGTASVGLDDTKIVTLDANTLTLGVGEVSEPLRVRLQVRDRNMALCSERALS